MRFWKISHGSQIFGKEEHQQYLREGRVVVNRYTHAKGQLKTSQGESFAAPERKHDLFFVCRGNDSIDVIGVFADSEVHPLKDDSDGWIYRRFVEIARSHREGGYRGAEKKWWLPNDNSTFISIKDEELPLFEQEVLQPFFQKNLEEISAMAEKAVFQSRYLDLLRANKNIVLTGAPGTGKTYLAKELAGALVGGDQRDQRIRFVQFHPSYDYTDFVEGLRPVHKDGTLGFELQDGVFKEFCNQARTGEESQLPYVFIIDEINRAEVSKVFGELFFSLDPGYRGKKGEVETQYASMHNSGDGNTSPKFYVPENVYIIATMNDIDRSVEPFDFAIRRRFGWIEVTPEDRAAMLDSLPEETWKEQAKHRMASLNASIRDTKELGRAYQIGPAYFLKVQQYNGNFDELWSFHIKGLLTEYLRAVPHAGKLLEQFRDAYDSPQLDE